MIPAVQRGGAGEEDAMTQHNRKRRPHTFAWHARRIGWAVLRGVGYLLALALWLAPLLLLPTGG